MKSKALNLLLLVLLPLTSSLNAQELTENEQAQLDVALQEVFPLAQKTQLSLLTGGFSGASLYKLETFDDKENLLGTYVLRTMPEESILQGECFLEASLIASDLGISPKIHYVAQDKSLLIMDFIAGETLHPKRFRDPEILKTVVSHLHKLHQGPLLSDPGMQMSLINHTLLDSLNDHGHLTQEVYESIQTTILKIQAAFDVNPHKVSTHLDLHKENILEKDGEVFFIDWETAGLDDPFADLARLAILMYCNPQEKEQLLSLYLEGPIAEVHRAKLRLMEAAVSLEGALWAHFQAAQITPAANDSIQPSTLEALLEDSNIPSGNEFLDAFYNQDGKLETAQEFEALGNSFLREFLLYTRSEAFAQDLQAVSLE
tara:strand:+ start:22023 stop:23141 length:1119 start_codon:yes stop_codon:yes gene_type:complete